MPFLALWSAVLNQYSISYLPSCPERAWVSISSSPELCLAWATRKCLAPVYLERQPREGWSIGQQNATGNPPPPSSLSADAEAKASFEM